MNTDLLIRWVTLGANFSVLVGIIFLAIEISQNTQVNRSIAIDAIQSATREQVMAPVNDEHLLEILVKSWNEEDLTELEDVKLSLYFETYLRHLENVLYQNRSGLLDSNLFRSYEADVFSFTKRTQFARNNWNTSRHLFSDEFQAYVERVEVE